MDEPDQSALPLAEFANLHFVTPNLAIGGDIAEHRQLADFTALGITHVIDCRVEWDDMEMLAEHLPSVGYLHHGMDDAGQHVPDEWFDAAIAWIDRAGPDAVVLTHCHMGINRGPSLGFAVLLHQGWDAIDAIEAIRAARPIAYVWYAPDALRWHHTRQGTDPYDDLVRLEAWRDENPLDVVHTIRQQTQYWPRPVDDVRGWPILGVLRREHPRWAPWSCAVRSQCTFAGRRRRACDCRRDQRLSR